MSTPAAMRRQIERMRRAQVEELLRLADIPHPYPATTARQYAKIRERAEEGLVHRVAEQHARPLFDDMVVERARWFPKRGKGHRIDERKSRFKAWYRGRIGPGASVYTFWKGKRCIYVGRTERGGGRPAGHFDKHWFRAATRIDILIPHQKRQVASLECLAMHLYDPLKNKVRSSRKSYRTACPVCKRTKAMLAQFDALV